MGHGNVSHGVMAWKGLVFCEIQTSSVGQSLAGNRRSLDLEQGEVQKQSFFFPLKLLFVWLSKGVEGNLASLFRAWSDAHSKPAAEKHHLTRSLGAQRAA